MGNRRKGCLILVVLGAFFGFCLFPVMNFPAEVVLYLTLGWGFFLYRVLPQVTLTPSGLTTGLICLTLFTVGSQWLLSWLYPAIREAETDRWPWKWTGAIVGVIVLMFMAGVGATGVVHQTGWLLSAPEPWISGYGVRVAARRMQSMNNLKQIALAVANYESANGTLPPGATMGEYGTLLHSWQTLLLPDLDQSDLYNALDLKKPWDDPVNLSLFHTQVEIFRSPAVQEDRIPGLALTHYEGNVRVVGGTRGLKLADVTDGASNTILAGEIAGGFQPWGKPGHWRDPADGINRDPARGFGSRFPGGTNVNLLDGSVKFIKNTIDPRLLKALSTPAGGEAIVADPY